MAQAERITTAICELMSRERPPKSTSPVKAAHAEFVAALVGNPPQPIHADLDSQDLEARAEYLEKVLAALHVYLVAVIGETAQSVPNDTLDRRYLEKSFRTLSADAVCAIRNAAEEMREREIWRAS